MEAHKLIALVPRYVNLCRIRLPLTVTRCFKAAILLGLPFRAVPVTAEDQYALRGDALLAAIETDVAAGLIPFLASETYK